jgi:phage FluMu protein Com
MPIRFRCRHCNQLLGIARRKAGCEVECPRCKKHITVPNEERAATEQAANEAPLFERADFDDYLEEADHPQPSILGTPGIPRVPRQEERAAGSGVRVMQPPSSSPSYDVEPASSVAPTTAAGGVVLTRRQARWLTIVAILSIALASGPGSSSGDSCCDGAPY